MESNETEHTYGLPSRPMNNLRSVSLPQALNRFSLSKPSCNVVENCEGEVSGARSSSTGNAFRALGRSRTAPKLSIYTAPTLFAPIPEPEHEYVNIQNTNTCASGAGAAARRALSTPEILREIFEALDAQSVVPHELVQQRRKPLSLRHAQLMFGNTKKAVEALESQEPTTSAPTPPPGLYNCLLVNRMWFRCAVRVLERQIYFRSSERWLQFARRGAPALQRLPKKLVLHKLEDATQVEVEMLSDPQTWEQLEWLEFYTCANIAPTPSLLGPQLTKIVLPGCFRVNDRVLAHIAERCPQLRHLDVRACALVSDRGIKLIAKYCPQLELLNVGRTYGGELITYKGIKHLARQTNISTLGVAGCHVNDRAIWELALNRGPHLERLSLNQCTLLSDYGVPKAISYMPNLTVLEIRGCIHITHMRPIVMFKMYRERQGQPPLIEGCEVTERRLQEAINAVHRERNHRVLHDLECWANS